MRIIIENGLRTQIADEGMYLNNGDIFVKSVDLGIDAEPWEEVPESELPGTETVDTEAEIIP